MDPPDWSPVFRPTTRRVLNALTRGSRSLSDLAKETGLAKPSLLRHVRVLEGLGLVEKSYRSLATGREVVFTLSGLSIHLEIRPGPSEDPLAGTILEWESAGYTDPAFPLTAQIPQSKERDEVARILRLGVLRHERHDDLFIVLFGSVARGEATWKSDIDLLIVAPDEDATDAKFRDSLADLITAVQDSLQHAVTLHFVGRSGFLGARSGLVQEVIREGRVVFSPDLAEAEVRELWGRIRRSRTLSD